MPFDAPQFPRPGASPARTASSRLVAGLNRRAPLRRVRPWRAFSSRVADVRHAVTTWPSAGAWVRSAWIYVAFLACALPLGIVSGLVHVSAAPMPPLAAAIVAVTLFVHPALTEEIVFRALLLPRDPATVPRRRVAVAAIVALIVYVAAHPLNAKLFWPAALAVFANPWYLVLATLLGVACTTAYLISGSIWPPVVMHWVTVALWILVLGGQRLLMPRT